MRSVIKQPNWTAKFQQQNLGNSKYCVCLNKRTMRRTLMKTQPWWLGAKWMVLLNKCYSPCEGPTMWVLFISQIIYHEKQQNWTPNQRLQFSSPKVHQYWFDGCRVKWQFYVMGCLVAMFPTFFYRFFILYLQDWINFCKIW